MRCPSCHHENPAGLKFCGECGAALAIVCPACRTPSLTGQKFCGECGARLGVDTATAGPLSTDSYTSTSLSDKIVAQKSTSEGERRQLTVLFCDMVGFTELANRVDPEILQGIIRSYEDACAVCITRYDGYVFQRLGDGIVAFFGYPLAHEGEAERAVHAGLEIIDALRKLEVPEAGHLAVRIGIATGLVVVSSAEKGAVGETMNLASRLQGIAQPGNIVVSERVQRLAGGSFDYQDLGEQTLKGIARPARAWRILRVSDATSRFEAATQEGLTPLVGREQEIGLLLERWALAQDGEGQGVLLSGEPGIGKSRILNALRERLEGQGAQALRFQCSPYYINSAFWPSIDNFERALKFARDESPDSKLDKLEALVVEHYRRPKADVRYLGAMLSLPVEARYGPLQMTPQRFKDETLRALVDLTEAAARKHPAILLFEDAHWADPTSLDVLDLLIDRVKSFPLLALITHRPEFQNRWASHGHVTALNLTKLTKAQSGAMVTRITKDKALPGNLFEQILTKTDGIPLFVEELTKSILESGELKDAGDHYEYAGTTHSITIPATLRDSLMARLDRYMPVKEIAQIGAAIGREFSYGLISAVAPRSKAELDDALERLTASGLAFRRGTPPEATYTFKHALVQDAAYDSLLKSRRQELHGKIARVIQERFPATKDTEPEVLAHHLTAAGLAEAAIPLWSSAGQKALARTALPEAVAHLSKALELVQPLPPTEQRDRSELDIRINLAIAQMAYAGWAYIEIPKTLTPAKALAEKLADTKSSLIALYYIWLHNFCIPNLAEARAHADRILKLAEASADRSALLVANMTISVTACLAGEWELAKLHGDRVQALYDFERDSSLTHLLNQDVQGLFGWDCNYYWALGFPQKAREVSLAHIENALKIDHSFNLLFSLTGETEGLFLTGDSKRALEFNRKARILARENAMSFAENGPCDYFGGPALIADGQYAEGYEMATRAVAFWNLTGGTIRDPMVNNHRAYALGMLDRIDEGIALAEETLRYTHSTNHRTWEPVTHCVLGDLLVKAHQPGDKRLQAAEAAYGEALRISRSRSAKGFELIAATGLARLWRHQDKKKEALELLKPVYDWFTEGFDTKDLKEAKGLLDELGMQR